MTNLLFENVEDLSLVAVRESEQSVSYLQLREKIAKRAAGIRKHLGVDAKIAVYLPRSINQMVSMLAIFEAGLTYVPIDVDVAQERVEYIINKADCESIITTQELYNSLDENIKQTTSFLDTVLIDSEGVLENEENNKINNDTDAYIIFTSGTTGNPIAIGIPVSSRGSNSNECIGPFINTVPVLIRNTNDIKDYMEQSRDEYYSFIENREVPLQLILKNLKTNTKRDMVRSLFSVLFAEISNSNNASNELIKEIDLVPSKSKFDLALYYEFADNNLSFILDYDSSLFEQNTIDNFANMMRKKLYSIVNCNVEFETVQISSNYKTDEAGTEIINTNETVLGLLSNLLRNNEILISDDFFELGGDSIIAIKFIAELRNQGYIVQVADLFDNPNIEDFVLKLKKNTNKKADVINFKKKGYKLTDVQKGILWECVNNTEASQLYHQQFDIKLPYDLDLDILQSIINELTDKTPVLRNAVSFDDEMYPMQEPIMDRKINVEVIYNKSAEQVLEFDKSLKFDFLNSPLIRFYYVKEESNASHLIISYHHILLDGWSITYIIEQIFGNYQNVAQGKPILISYNNYFQQIVDREETNVVDAKIEKYWEKEIEKIVPVEIEQKSGGSNLKSIFIEEDIVASIIEYAKNNKVTVNSIFLAAYIKALIGEAGKKTLGITLSGREDVSEEEMAAVGCLIKTLPSSSIEKSWIYN